MDYIASVAVIAPKVSNPVRPVKDLPSDGSSSLTLVGLAGYPRPERSLTLFPMTQPQSFSEFLRRIADTEPGTIRSQVAFDALDADDPAVYFQDVMHHGCVSGVVPGLVYYTDTHTFFDAHYEEIEELRYAAEEEFGLPLQPQGDLKNWFAWWAYETVVAQLWAEMR